MNRGERRRHEEWLRDRCPNDAGSEHWWGWTGEHERGAQPGRDIFWLHRCKGRLVLGTIDVTTPIHTLVSEEPLHVEPSILCTVCGDHGFIRGGVWANA